MLFLVFQPSQRADRSSAVQSGSQSVAEAKSKRIGASAAPIILIVRNEGESPLDPDNLASTDYQLLSATPTSTPTGSDQIVLAATAPGGPVSFVPRDTTASFDAKISVERSGTILSQQVTCSNEGGGTVTVDPTAASPIHSVCNTSTLCEPGIALTFVPAGTAPPAAANAEYIACELVDQERRTLDQVKAAALSCGLGAELDGSLNQIHCFFVGIPHGILCNATEPSEHPTPFDRFFGHRRQICSSPTVNH